MSSLLVGRSPDFSHMTCNYKDPSIAVLRFCVPDGRLDSLDLIFSQRLHIWSHHVTILSKIKHADTSCSWSLR